MPTILAHNNENVSTLTTIIFCAMGVFIMPGIILYNGALYLCLMTWVTKLSDMATRAVFGKEIYHIGSTFYVFVDILNADFSSFNIVYLKANLFEN